ncbi:MAG: TonB-dependent receptor [Acidobacteria bacterium]|nr:TonB-dependent receptor [Acidobacteriota bacterium]
MLSFARRAAFLSVLVVIASAPMVAQRPTGTISGVITDETRAVLPGVSIVVTNTETNIGRAVISDDQGRYQVANLDPGLYSMRAELSGFKTGVRDGIQLTIGREAVIDFMLGVGEVSEKVLVTGDAPLVETSTGTLGGLVTQAQIVDLPLNGRGFQDLMGLQAGVVLVGKANSDISQGMGSKFSVSGARFSYNQFLMDGAEMNDHRDSTPASVAGIVMGVESVREFAVLTNNYSAEYGRNAGAVMSVVSKSGSNRFRGSVYAFHRNSALDARNFFERGGKLPFKRNQFGVEVDGPIVKDRTFFMVNYEGLRQRLEVPQTLITLTAAARQGILPGRPPIAVDPNIRPYLALYPLPTPGGTIFPNGTGEFLLSSRRPIEQNYLAFRLDHQLSQSTSLMGRYSTDKGSSETRGADFLQGSQDTSRTQNTVVEAKTVITPVLLNTAIFALNRPKLGNIPLVTAVTPAFTVEGLPDFGSIGVPGLNSLGQQTVNQFNQLTLMDVSDSVAYIRGNQSFKFGGMFKRFFYTDFSGGSDIGGVWDFDSIEDLLRNQASEMTMPAPGFDPEIKVRQNLIAFYAQDDLRLSPRLTVNLGLRYEFVTVPYEIHGRNSNLRSLFDSNLTVGKPMFENPSLKNFAPRVGFAWDIFGDRKMALRGGFGIFHGQLLPRSWERSFRRNPPFFNTAIKRPPGPIPFPRSRFGELTNIPLNELESQPIVFTPSTPYMMQYNLGLERQISQTLVVRAAYVGSRGVHLTRVTNWNINFPYQIRDGKKFFPTGLRRRNPALSSVRLISTDANSAYNSLQLGLTHRLSEGFQVQANYNFARSVDDGTEAQSNAFRGSIIRPQDPDDRSSFRGLSDFHIQHSFVVNTVYELPWGKGWTGPAGKLAAGWGVSSILRLASGSPFAIELGFDRSRTGERQAQRPNLKAGFSNSPILGGPDQYFDVNAFELQPAGFFGDLGRNTLIGPGMATVDFSLLKNILVPSVSESFRVQFRAEFFNIFNRPNFAVPQPAGTGGVRAISNSGAPILSAAALTKTATTSRQIQFGLKVLF